MARPSKLTAEAQDTIVGALRAGLTDDTACALAGIAPRTLQSWMERGRRPGRAHARHRALLEAVEAARADAVASLVGRMTLAAQRGSWRAACWLLEREYPERWGPR